LFRGAVEGGEVSQVFEGGVVSLREAQRVASEREMK